MESNQFCCANKPVSANSGLLRNEAHYRALPAKDKNVPIRGALPTLKYEEGQGHRCTTVSPDGLGIHQSQGKPLDQQVVMSQKRPVMGLASAFTISSW